MRICDLCESRDEVKTFAYLMHPSDFELSPKFKDLCYGCAERVRAAWEAALIKPRPVTETVGQFECKPADEQPKRRRKTKPQTDYV